MRTLYTPSTVRNILCVFPRYAPSFGTFHHAYSLLGGVRAFMPPQGLLLVAAFAVTGAADGISASANDLTIARSRSGYG